MSEKRFKLIKIDDYVFQIKDIDNDLYLVAEQICNLLNEQQATIELYKRSVNKREEQISIIKKYCLKFLTDEQFETIRKALEDE